MRTIQNDKFNVSHIKNSSANYLRKNCEINRQITKRVSIWLRKKQTNVRTNSLGLTIEAKLRKKTFAAFVDLVKT